MDSGPEEMLRTLPAGHRDAAERWWSGLAAEERRELASSWDPALPPELVLIGRPVDPEIGPETREAKQQLFDYVAANPEIRFYLEERRLHICRAHPAARALIRAGRIPAAFRCPAGDPRCPMRAISAAAGDRDVYLEIGARHIGPHG